MKLVDLQSLSPDLKIPNFSPTTDINPLIFPFLTDVQYKIPPLLLKPLSPRYVLETSEETTKRVLFPNQFGFAYCRKYIKTVIKQP